MGENLTRYVRQTIFSGLGEEGQRRLLASRVLLVGVGALGSHIADLLVRAGVGHLILVDRDFLELNNLQRQTLYTQADVEAGLPKAIAAARHLAEINPEVTVEPQVVDLNAGNVEALLEGIDLVVDGTDNMETRYVLNDACVKRGIPWVYGGVIGATGMAMTVRPGEGPCLRCVFRDPPPPGSLPTCDVAGVVGPAVAAVAAVEAAEAMKLLAGVGTPLPGLLTLDLWEGSFEVIGLPPEPVPDCPACGRREFPFLEVQQTTLAASLCGRNAVQVVPPPGTELDLEALARRLEGFGPLRQNEYLLQVELDGYVLTLFRDGRAIVQGTDDPATARTLYARYVGQ